MPRTTFILRLSLQVCLIMVMALGSVGRPQRVVAAPVPRIQFFRLPTPLSLEIPALYGDTLAWAGQGKDHLERLYTGNVRHFKPHVMTVARSGYFIIQLHLSAEWIAWEEQSPRGAWAIWAMNRSSGRKTLVDSSEVAGNAPQPLMFPGLSLAGDTIAWAGAACRGGCRQQMDGWRVSVHIKSLPDGADRVIMTTKAPCSQTWPALSDRYLAWHQEGVCGGHPGTDVLLYDRHTQRTRFVTSDHQSSEATTNGPYLAWKKAPGRLQNGSIRLLDLRTGRVSVASDHLRTMGGCLSDRNTWVGCAAEPQMSGSVLAWGAGNGGVLVARDLHSGHQYILEGGSRTGRPGYGVGHLGIGWENRVVWQAWTASRVGQTYATRLIGLATVP